MIQDNPRAPVYLDRAEAWLALQQFEAAERDVAAALGIDDNNHRAYAMRGVIHLRQNRPDAAVADFSRSLALNPSNDDDYYQRALAYQLAGQFKDSLADLDHWLEVRPGHKAGYILRAEIQDRLGRKDLAHRDRQIADRLSAD